MADTASTIMTRNVITVGPDAGLPEIAAKLTKYSISAVPVVDASGKLLGMVSEGDLMQPFAAQNRRRRAWWLEMLVEGGHLAPEFLEYISLDHHTASDLMVRKVITAAPNTPIPDIADLLMRHHIKRVPIVQDGGIVGVVSRADIVRAIARTAVLDLPQAS